MCFLCVNWGWTEKKHQPGILNFRHCRKSLWTATRYKKWFEYKPNTCTIVLSNTAIILGQSKVSNKSNSSQKASFSSLLLLFVHSTQWEISRFNQEEEGLYYNLYIVTKINLCIWHSVHIPNIKSVYKLKSENPPQIVRGRIIKIRLMFL